MVKNTGILKKIILLILYVVILIIGVYALYCLNMTYNIGLICIYNKITGLYCPGCGMTRAIYSLFKLDFYQAFRYNVFSIILFPILLIYLFGEIYARVFDKKNYISSKIPSIYWIIIAVAMISYGILRNFEIFGFLAPTIVG